MKIIRSISIIFSLAVTMVLIYIFCLRNNKIVPVAKLKPYEDLHIMRNYPDFKTAFHPYLTQIKFVAKQVKNTLKGGDSDEPVWQIQGPFNVSGRMNTIAHNPGNDQIIYVGNVCGGIYKTTDGGKNWRPIFDENSYLSIAHIVVSPHDTNTLYVGTGDPNISGYPWVGNGIYKSSDAGATWQHLGLEEVGIVTKIAVHPQNKNIIYAATMGLPFERDENRGLYKTIDGGKTWSKILFLSTDSGIIDMVMVPQSPDTIFVAGWNRIRNYNESLVYGPQSKIYRTYNGGETWETLAIDLPETDMSRIGLYLSVHDSIEIVAHFIKPVSYETEGIFKSSDFGSTWAKLPALGIDSRALGGFGWYFGKIRVNPFNNKQFFMLGVDLYRSTDGGETFANSSISTNGVSVHADKHDLVFIDSSVMLLSTDGGLYKSIDGGINWEDIDNIPNTQFYRVAVDPFNKGFYCAGAQDNGTNYGSQTDSANWTHIFGGDGFQPMFDYKNKNLIYTETQNGELYYGINDVEKMVWYGFNGGIDQNDRRSWDMPICMSKQNTNVIYTGTYRVYVNKNAPEGYWEAISDDLTDGTESNFHVISAIHVSALNDNKVVAGTSDGRIHTFDGSNWENRSAGLPERYVTCIKLSLNEQNNLFVSHSGYKANEYIPHIHFSEDFGSSWTDISGNLPQLAINSMHVFNSYGDSVIFVATDGGIYHTLNRGEYWERTGAGMPVIPVYDLAYDDTNNTLVAATFARSIMALKLDKIIAKYNTVADAITELKLDAALYPNPASDFVVLSFDKQIIQAQITVYNLVGQLIWTGTIANSSSTQINIASFLPGTYLVTVLENNKAIATKKFIKCLP